MQAAAELLRTEPDELVAAIGRVMERQRESEKELSKLRQKSSEAEAGALAAGAAADGGVVVARRDSVDGDALRSLAQAVLRHDGVRAVVLGGLPTARRWPSQPPPVAIPTRSSWCAPWVAWSAGAGADRRGGAGRREGPLADRGGLGRGAATPVRVSDGGQDPTAPAGGPGRGPGRVAALDLGTRRIGVAYCDSGRTLASPWGTIERSGDAVRDRVAVVDAVREVEASTVVVGFP